MKKTLLKHSTENTKKAAEMQGVERTNEQLADLAQELKGAWQEAANDLLQPRPEAIARLLGKVLH